MTHCYGCRNSGGNYTVGAELYKKGWEVYKQVYKYSCSVTVLGKERTDVADAHY